MLYRLSLDHPQLTTQFPAARQALQRKKQHETALKQTHDQMMTVEREIFSIEAANINKETFDAMNGAKVAMKNIHGGLSIDKVDQTMEDLREQHDIGQQIAEALTQGNGMQGIDEDELDEELAQLQQEELDEKMLKTGSVPVSDRIHSLPSAANGPGEFDIYPQRHGGRTLLLRRLYFTDSDFFSKQSKRNPKLNSKKTTKRRNYGNCRRKWQCDYPRVNSQSGRILYEHYTSEPNLHFGKLLIHLLSMPAPANLTFSLLGVFLSRLM
jgi:hypothetical protein